MGKLADEKHHQRKVQRVKTILGLVVAGCSNQMQIAQGHVLVTVSTLVQAAIG